MAQLKQRTVESGRQKQTIELVRLENRFPDMSNNDKMYVIRDADTKDNLEDPMFNKREAERAFSTIVEQTKRGMSSGGGVGSGSGIFGESL